jgi:Family of unknown function (DUF5681)
MPETTGKNQGPRWQPSQSGNPAGRPKGTRHAALLALDSIGTAATKEVTAAVVAAAKGGDMRAADILLRRLWPERKGRPVLLELPTMKSATDLPAVLSVIAEAVATGDLTPDEGQPSPRCWRCNGARLRLPTLRRGGSWPWSKGRRSVGNGPSTKADGLLRD